MGRQHVTRMLADLTLDAVKARSIEHHLHLGEDQSHFNPNVSELQRLAALGEYIGTVFVHGGIVPDRVQLQRSLFDLATVALIWGELIDMDLPLNPGSVTQ